MSAPDRIDLREITDDHLTLLLAIGADTVGDVAVVPAGSDRRRPIPMFDPDRDTDFRTVFTDLVGSVDAVAAHPRL